MGNAFEREKYTKRLADSLKKDPRTEGAIAKAVNLSKSALSKQKSGISYPDLGTFANLAQTLGVSADYLLGLTDEKSVITDVRSLADNLGLLEESQATIKNVCEKLRLPDTSELEEYGLDFAPSFYENFSSKNVLNYILSDSKMVSEVISYAQKYVLLYVVERGFQELPDDSPYKIVDGKGGVGLQKKNAYNFFMLNYSFTQLMENVAKRIMDDIDLSTDKKAASAGVCPVEVRFGVPDDGIFDEFSEEEDFDG